MFKVPEHFRVKRGPMASSAANGNNGVFLMPSRPGQPPLQIIASDGLDWEHVSVSRPDRTPTWDEMCAVKAAFWTDDECVMQLHPPKADWVNNHPRCLHLWRPVAAEIPRPPSMMVGYAELGVLA